MKLYRCLTHLALLSLCLFATAACDSQTTQPLAAQADVWLTTADGQQRLSRQSALTFQAGVGSQSRQVQVDETSRHQQIEGFGAALTHAAAHVIHQSPQRNEIVRQLFSREGGIGISYVRLAMGASDFVAIPAYTYADAAASDPDLTSFSIAPDEAAIIPVLKEAKALNPALRLIASPWSAPAWMKTPSVLNGGKLRPAYYPVYAEYFARFIEAYQQHGLTIDAVTVQNEPHHTTDSYPSMRMEAAEQAAFVGQALGPLLAARHPGTKILIWDHNWDEPEFPLAVLQDADARQYVDGVAWHCYGGEVRAQSLVQQAYPDIDTYFTECSGGDWDANFGSVLRWNMRNLFIGALHHGARTVLLWNLALDENHGPHRGGCGDCRGVVTVGSNGSARQEPEYVLIGHFSKFVMPGATRIGATHFAGELETVAFLNPDGSKVLVVFNAGSQATGFDIAWNGQHAAYRGLPAGAAATFHWADGAAR